MPTPEPTAREGAGPVAAVRALLDALAVPAARQALLLEQALVAQMAVFTGAPAAATFDPLARPAASAASRGARPQPGAARRKAAPGKVGAPGIGLGLAGIGVAAAAALQAATQAPPAASLLTGIAAAVAALTAPDDALPRRPVAPSPESAVRGAPLGALGAVAQTAAQAAAQALDAVPGAGVTAPLLERIAQIGGALWMQAALSRSAEGGRPSAPVGDGAVRRGPAPRTPARAESGAAAVANSRPAAPAGAASRDAISPIDTVTDALAGIGRLTVELFGAAARAGAPNLLGTPARPAPRAPNLLAPERPTEPTSRPVSGPPATAAPGIAIDVGTDALARALRAEGELRGVAL